MDDSNSKLVQGYLAKPEIHRQWETAYRTPENEKFFEQAFDYIIRILNAPNHAMFLDVGCGICAHSVRLANRGFIIHSIDCSEIIVKEAKAHIKVKGLGSQIRIQCADILSLPFADESFRYVLCWGVLMHIPDLEGAIAELTRVLIPGGTLVVGEVNMYSLESIMLRNLKRFLAREKADVKKTSAGMEYWSVSSDGRLITRHANIGSLIERFKSNGFTVKKRVAGQFTEAYTRVSSQLIKNLIHGFNNLWFSYVRIPYPATGNILILQKVK